MKQPLKPNLPKLQTGDFFIEDEEILEGHFFEDSDQSYLTVNNLVIRESQLAKIVMQRTRLERFEASNVIFEKCDFSNLEWLAGSFHQVVFRQCKLTGTNFAESYLRDCTFSDCVANYASFSSTNLKVVHFENCHLNDSEFFEIKWNHLTFSGNQLNGANFMRSTMKGLNLTSNTFERIMLTQDNLKGLIVNPDQALVIAASLGLVIEF